MSDWVGKTLATETGRQCLVERELASGGQGTVYQVSVDGQPMALKWYHPHYVSTDLGLRTRLQSLVEKGPPTQNYLWPLELVPGPDQRTFGYLMPLREQRFRGIGCLLKRRVDPSFRALCTAGHELANGFLELHTKGLCYRRYLPQQRLPGSGHGRRAHLRQ